MAARPRIRKRAHFPPNLHEPRPGYFTWRDPRDGKTHILGRITAAEAIFEAQQANVVVESGTARRSLADRLSTGKETVSDLIDKMPTDGLAASTLEARRHHDKVIRAAIGAIPCASLTTKEVAALIEGMRARGVVRLAQAVRSRLNAICSKGVALGWMTTNPTTVTEKLKVKVKRRRMTLEEFNAILEKAPKVSDWLQDAMLLALVSGQDRSTVARWEAGFIQGGMAVLQRSKTSVKIAIPLALRLNVINMSLGEIVARCQSTGIPSKYLIHHRRAVGSAKRGGAIKLRTVTASFAEARALAEIKGDNAPTFHEIRSLSKRLYMEQGNVDTKALLGHMTDSMADLYANSRGLAPIVVKIGSAPLTTNFEQVLNSPPSDKG